MDIERTFATFAANTRQTATRLSANGPLFTYAYQRMDRINRTNPNKREYCFILYEIDRRTDHSYQRTDFCSFDVHPCGRRKLENRLGLLRADSRASAFNFKRSYVWAAFSLLGNASMMIRSSLRGTVTSMIAERSETAET